jgi:translation elongation factor IF5A
MSEEVKHIKAGSYVLYKDQPFQVKKNQIVVTGTHSHTKNRLDMKGVFSDQNESIVFPPHERLEILEILRKKAQIISKSPRLQIMDMVSYETVDAEADEKLLNELNEGDEVTYIEFNNARKVLEKRS